MRDVIPADFQQWLQCYRQRFKAGSCRERLATRRRRAIRSTAPAPQRRSRAGSPAWLAVSAELDLVALYAGLASTADVSAASLQ